MRATEELLKLNFKASKVTLHYITLIPGILGIYCTDGDGGNLLYSNIYTKHLIGALKVSVTSFTCFLSKREKKK
jgi:hypothetical protein